MPEIKLDISYTDADEFARGGQGVLYRAVSENGKRLVVKQYHRPADPGALEKLQKYIVSSNQNAGIFAERSHQAQFAPFYCDAEQCFEVMLAKPKDTTTVAAVIDRWNEKRICGLERVTRSVKCICSLLEALEKFHMKDRSGKGYVHRDIKPENLFVAGPDSDTPLVYPIDFGCCAEIGSDRSLESYSPGFTYPDLLSTEQTSIKCDIYSVCAVFIAMILGKPQGVNLFRQKSLAQKIHELEIPYGVARKIQQIVEKTVEFCDQELPRDLDCDPDSQMQQDFKILLQIIQQRGIHLEVLMDRTAEACALVKKRIYGNSFDGGLLPAIDGNITGNTLLLSPGGGGKTSTLIDLWQKKISAPVNTVPVYIPLSGFEKEDQLHWATYIRDWILTEYFQVGRSEENREELLTLFSRKDTRILLLLDGVNESLHTDRLAFEVSTLLEYPGVQVVLASRHANIPWDCLKTFHTVSLLPLDKELVNNRLEKAGLQKVTGRLLDTLTRPFFLCRYLKITKDGCSDYPAETPGEILFLHHLHLLDAFKGANHAHSQLLVRMRCLYRFLPEFSFRLNSMAFNSANYASLCKDIGLEKAETETFISILEECGFIYQTGHNPFTEQTYYHFAHQNYLHFYQTLYAATVIFSSNTALPAALNIALPDEVLQFLAEIWNLYQLQTGQSEIGEHVNAVSVEDWLQQHIAGKAETKTIVRNLLEVLKYQKQNQLQGISFDNLDFTDSDFHNCNLAGTTFHGATLPGRLFISSHHRHPLEQVLPAGSKIITSAQDETKLIAWNRTDGSYRFTMDTGEQILQYAVSPDQKILAAACTTNIRKNSRIYVFSLEDGDLRNCFPCSSFPIRVFSFLSGNETILLDHYGHGLREFHISTGEESIIEDSNMGPLDQASASPDGSLFLKSFECRENPTSVLFSLQPFELHTVDQNGNRSVRNLCHRTQGAAICKWVFSSDNHWLIGETLYGKNRNLVVFDIDKGKRLKKVTAPGKLQCASNRYIFTSEKVWDYQEDRDVSSIFGYEPYTKYRVSLSVDGKLAVITKGQDTVTVFNVENGQCVLRYQPAVIAADSLSCCDAQIHIAGRSVLRRLPSGYVDCLDFETNTVRHLFRQNDGGRLVFCRDARFILQEHRHTSTFTLWDILSGKQISTCCGSLENVQTAQYFPNAQNLILIEEKPHTMKNSWLPMNVSIYDILSSPEARPIDTGSTAEISSCAIIGEKIVLGTTDGTLQVLACAGTLLAALQVHKAAVSKLLPVIGSDRVVSHDADGRIVLLDLHTLKCWDVCEDESDLSKFDLSVGVAVDASTCPDQWPADSKLFRRILSYENGTLFRINTMDFAYDSRICGAGKLFLTCNIFLHRTVSDTVDGHTLFELTSMDGTEIIASASVSDDGELMAVIASNGKAEVYTRNDPVPLIWDVLDVSNMSGADLTRANLVCSGYIREQLQLNGAILSDFG